jgi:hypothetical protein
MFTRLQWLKALTLFRLRKCPKFNFVQEIPTQNIFFRANALNAFQDKMTALDEKKLLERRRTRVRSPPRATSLKKKLRGPVRYRIRLGAYGSRDPKYRSVVFVEPKAQSLEPIDQFLFRTLPESSEFSLTAGCKIFT